MKREVAALCHYWTKRRQGSLKPSNKVHGMECLESSALVDIEFSLRYLSLTPSISSQTLSIGNNTT